MNKEDLLKIWFDTEPTEHSPYKINGCPPMWETIKNGDLTLYTRPAPTMHRRTKIDPYTEVPGVSYQWQRDGAWVGQGHSTTFEEFEMNGPNLQWVQNDERKLTSSVRDPKCDRPGMKMRSAG